MNIGNKLIKVGQMLGIIVSAIAFLLISSMYFILQQASALPNLYEAFIIIFSLGILPPIITLIGFMYSLYDHKNSMKFIFTEIFILFLITLLNLNYVFNIEINALTLLLPFTSLLIFLATFYKLFKSIEINEVQRIFSTIYGETIIFIGFCFVRIIFISDIFSVFGLLALLLFLIFSWFKMIFYFQKEKSKKTNDFESTLFLLMGIGNMLIYTVLGSYTIGLLLLPSITLLTICALSIELRGTSIKDQISTTW